MLVNNKINLAYLWATGSPLITLILGNRKYRVLVLKPCIGELSINIVFQGASTVITITNYWY